MIKITRICRAIIILLIKQIFFIAKTTALLVYKTIMLVLLLVFGWKRSKKESLSKQFSLPPPRNLLPEIKDNTEKYLTSNKELEAQQKKIIEKLASFGINGEMVFVQKGTLINLFAFLLKTNIKVSKILALENDLAMVLKTSNVRILAPIPEKNLIGFEVAKNKSAPIYFANILRAPTWLADKSSLSLAIGQRSDGTPFLTSLTEMPHLLIAGATGSGKSVCIHTLLASLIFTNHPDNLKLVLIDPKQLELAFYKDIPHLLFPVVTEMQQVTNVLTWLVNEMLERYKTIATAQCRDLKEYNQVSQKKLPFIVVVIDELADLIMVAGKNAELLLIRLGQMARAAGIHLIVATQRPSVDVVTGLIKVNFPTRMAFRVASKIDSRVIIDTSGAEKLLGKGDMLFLHPAQRGILRLTSFFISASEIEKATAYLRKAGKPNYIKMELNKEDINSEKLGEQDEFYEKVIAILPERREISISLVQRKFGIGYNRAARIIENLEADGLVGPSQNGKPRKIL